MNFGTDVRAIHKYGFYMRTEVSYTASGRAMSHIGCRRNSETVKSQSAVPTQAIRGKGGILAQRINKRLGSFVMFIKANVLKVLPILSFVMPILLLYWIDPNTFEPVWRGTFENRMYYLFFVWILVLETILSWEELKTRKFDIRSAKSIIFVVSLLLPIIYVILANFSGLNELIVIFATERGLGLDWARLMPLSTEYLVFAALLTLIIVMASGRHGLKNYLTSTFFLALVGAVYTINNVYPFGEFTPFQILVVPTAVCASSFLTLVGYTTSLSTQGTIPLLTASNSKGSFVAQIDWPCSGVESLLIYSVVILLFLRKSAIPLTQKIIYFVVGAIVTYFINVLRIATIYVIAINGGDWGLFHDYYGSFYSITWIICYLLIIIGTQVLLKKIRNWKVGNVKDNHMPNHVGF
jgi:thaumarchaeosortase